MICYILEKVQTLFQASLVTLIFIAIFVVAANNLGWLDRWIWYVLESEARKVMNNAQVTMGSFAVDWSRFLEMKITLHASNVIIHTPQKEAWGTLMCVPRDV